MNEDEVAEALEEIRPWLVIITDSSQDRELLGLCYDLLQYMHDTIGIDLPD